MRILLIQSRTRPEMVAVEQEEFARAIGNAAEMSVVSSLDESLPWDRPAKLLEGIDAVILGGSGEFDLDGGREESDPARMTAREIEDRLRPLVSHLIEHDFPTLGVCFGHQLIGDICGGTVMNDPLQKKIGTHDTHLTEEGEKDDLFGQLPATFSVQYGHKDSITKLPQGAVLLASSPNCSFAALRYGTRIRTLQGHPELTRDDVIRRLNNSPGYLPEGINPGSIVRESADASRIIPLFISTVS